MAKFRCPQCGAMNPTADGQCRLCGTRLGVETETVTPARTAVAPRRSSSTKGIVFIALGIVLAIALGAVFLGIVQSNRVIETAKSNVPGLGAAAADGWHAVTDPDGGFSVELPGTPTKESKADAVTWTAKVAKDVVILVGYVPLAEVNGAIGQPPTGTIAPKDLLEQYATSAPTLEADAQINEKKPLIVGGHPALYVDKYTSVKDHPVLLDAGNKPDDRAYTRALYVLKGDRVYFVVVSSLLKGAEQYDRVSGTFGFTS